LADKGKKQGRGSTSSEREHTRREENSPQSEKTFLPGNRRPIQYVRGGLKNTWEPQNKSASEGEDQIMETLPLTEKWGKRKSNCTEAQKWSRGAQKAKTTNSSNITDSE